MKIKVGKTYKDGNGLEWTVEYESPNISGKRFLTISTGKGVRYCMRDEYGTRGAGFPSSHNLLPNTVKKEGWINLYRNIEWEEEE